MTILKETESGNVMNSRNLNLMGYLNTFNVQFTSRLTTLSL